MTNSSPLDLLTEVTHAYQARITELQEANRTLEESLGLLANKYADAEHECGNVRHLREQHDATAKELTETREAYVRAQHQVSKLTEQLAEAAAKARNYQPPKPHPNPRLIDAAAKLRNIAYKLSEDHGLDVKDPAIAELNRIAGIIRNPRPTKEPH